MLWLPHIVRVREEDTTHSTRLLDWVANLPIEKNRWGIVLIGALTLVFGWFSSGTRFDANIGHLNYMAPEQRADKEYLQQLTSAAASGRQCLYVVSKGSSMDEALDRSGQRTNFLRQFHHAAADQQVLSPAIYFPVNLHLFEAAGHIETCRAAAKHFLAGMRQTC